MLYLNDTHARRESWLLVLVVWALLWLPGRSQAQGLGGANGAAPIASLTTAAQVQEFVRARNSKYTDYKEFRLTDSLDIECDSALVCLAPGGRTSWLKADFDGNGRTDLLVTGYLTSSSSRRRITCFLDLGEQKFTEIRLNSRVNDCALFQLSRAENVAAIRYAHIVVDRGYEEPKKPPMCQADTLIFDKTQFIEYNHTPKNYHIQKIAFSTTKCYGICPVFKLRINQNGAATYQAGEYNKKEGDFKATIEAGPLRELWALLNYLNFPKLNEYYAIGATDNPTCTLTIIYANGQVKTIEDYGEEGTFGLSRAYELLFALRTTQDWKPR